MRGCHLERGQGLLSLLVISMALEQDLAFSVFARILSIDNESREGSFGNVGAVKCEDRFFGFSGFRFRAYASS
jgi:hypothetical protein